MDTTSLALAEMMQLHSLHLNDTSLLARGVKGVASDVSYIQKDIIDFMQEITTDIQKPSVSRPSYEADLFKKTKNDKNKN